jgi:hypothetical protein
VQNENEIKKSYLLKRVQKRGLAVATMRGAEKRVKRLTFLRKKKQIVILPRRVSIRRLRSNQRKISLQNVAFFEAISLATYGLG